jgi:hypothetical protein
LGYCRGFGGIHHPFVADVKLLGPFIVGSEGPEYFDISEKVSMNQSGSTYFEYAWSLERGEWLVRLHSLLNGVRK